MTQDVFFKYIYISFFVIGVPLKISSGGKLSIARFKKKKPTDRRLDFTIYFYLYLDRSIFIKHMLGENYLILFRVKKIETQRSLVPSLRPKS